MSSCSHALTINEVHPMHILLLILHDIPYIRIKLGWRTRASSLLEKPSIKQLPPPTRHLGGGSYKGGALARERTRLVYSM